MKSLLILLLLVGCGIIPPMHLIEGRHYRIDQSQRIIFGKTPEIVDMICRQRGVQISAVPYLVEGCFSDSDGVIVLMEGTRPGEAVWEHEMAHRRGWRHP